MKRRILSLTLAAGLTLGAAALPSSAAGPSEEMARVTLAVKEQLGVEDEYESFSGDCMDLGVTRFWGLEWSREEGESLQVTADSTGKILSYDRYIPGGSQPVPLWERSGYNPSFLPVSAGQVEEAAGAFLSRVVSAPESARLEPVRLRPAGSRTSVAVSGTILLNGVDTPVGFSMSLSLPDLTVTSYSRWDSWFFFVTGETPSEQPAVRRETAWEALNSVLSLELRYVDDGGSIALWYVPTTQGDWFVDAQTGELTDLSKLADGDPRPFPAGGADKNESAADSTLGAPALSPVEQATVDQMAGVLDAGELDRLLQAIAPLGLKRMTQAGASYYMDRESKEITCRLTYVRPLTRSEAEAGMTQEEFEAEKPELRKYITVDAATGGLQRVSTSAGRGRDVFQGDGGAVVKGFLSAQFPERFAACTGRDEEGSLWVRQANGIPYDSNFLRAEVCRVDGTIGSFSMEWDDQARFPAPEGIVNEEAAMAAYSGCYTARLFYTLYPEKVDGTDPRWAAYVRQVGEIAYRWVLSYVLEGDSPQGVDAFTGAVVPSPGGTDQPLEYTDLDGCPGKAEIERLARYGVGFGRSGLFRPGDQVRQRDMLVLLLSAAGLPFDADAMSGEEEDRLYDAAVSRGLLAKEERDPDRAVTRLELLKTLLTASAYGKAAQLEGIYQVSFADAGAIPAGGLGYAAMAQGLGLVSGSELRPGELITRQDAAVILCRFMAR